MKPIVSPGPWMVVFFLFLASSMFAQDTTITVDLSTVTSQKNWKIANRTATPIEERERKGIRFDERMGEGIAWLEGYQFSDGVLEFEVRGKDEFQRSFVGIAFHVAAPDTFDAVYFRPFNFRNPDKLRANHSVQYISHPDYPWHRLRRDKPDQYEKPVNPIPDPNGWFHVRVVIDKLRVSVFVEGSKTPSLVVDQLSARGGVMVGLFLGSSSGGDFANLKVTPAVAQ